MNLTTITEVPVDEARAMYEEYRALGERSTAEDKLITAVYREIARGRQVIDVKAAIREGGHDDLGRPLLAFGRADEPEMECWRGSAYSPDSGRWEPGTGDLVMAPTVRQWGLPTVSTSRKLEMSPAEVEGWLPLVAHWFAMMPIIPPALRPRGHLSRYHILWEAEWRAKSSLPRAPRDPALLRRITGDLYAVLSVWDLTEVERIVLGMTRRAT